MCKPGSLLMGWPSGKENARSEDLDQSPMVGLMFSAGGKSFLLV